MLSKVVFQIFIKFIMTLQACQVIAGFSKTQQDYFAHWALFQLSHPIGWYEDRILPQLATLRQQTAHPTQEDTFICSNKLLHHLIPYFLEVVVQDGLSFVEDFPSHPFSQPLAQEGMFKFVVLVVSVSSFVPSTYLTTAAPCYMILEQNSCL